MLEIQKKVLQEWLDRMRATKAGAEFVLATMEDNLSTAMRSEAFAYAKYMLYAEHARTGGNFTVTDLLEKTAKSELLEHFAEQASLAELVKNDAENLATASSF